MAINPLSVPNFGGPYSGGADFAPLGNLGNVYQEAQKRQRLENLGKLLASGGNYQQAASMAAELGDPKFVLGLLDLSEAQKKQMRAEAASKNFMQNIYGGGGGAAAPGRTSIPEEEPSTPPSPPLSGSPIVPAVTPTPITPTTPAITGGTAPSYPGGPMPSLTGQASIFPPVTPTPFTPTTPPVTGAPPLPSSATAALTNVPRSTVMAAQEQAAKPPEEETPYDRMTNPNMIPYYLKALADPDLPKEQKDVGTTLLKTAIEAAKPTEKIATLQAMMQHPELKQLAMEMARAGATTVNVGGQKAYSAEMGRKLGEFQSKAIEDATNAAGNKANLEMARRAMSTPGFASGTFEPAITATRRALVGLGAADQETAKALGANEMFNKLQNRAIMDAGRAASGLGPSISNNDAKIIANSSYNSQLSTGGNEKIIAYMNLLEDRKVDYTREMGKYISSLKKEHLNEPDYEPEYMDVAQHMAEWANKTPLDFSKVPGFSEADKNAAEVQSGGTTAAGAAESFPGFSARRRR
jgi:hypothetical protein